MTFRNRFLLLTFALAVISVLGFSVADFSRFSPAGKATSYFLGVCTVIGFNFLRLHHIRDREMSWNLYHHIPTTTGLVRALVAFGLTITFFSNTFPYWPALIYLGYFYFIASTYDTAEYHQHFYRGVRTIADWLFAALFFLSFGGLRNYTWFLFLVPITTISRYYVSWKLVLTTAASILFVTLFSLFGDRNSLAVVDFAIVTNNIGEHFSGYLQSADAITNWQSFKMLLVADLTMLVASLIFYAETKNRTKGIFDFATRFFAFIRRSGKEVSKELINFLCIELNLEGLIVLTKAKDRPLKIQASFQNHVKSDNYNSRCCYKADEIDGDSEKKIDKWWKGVMDYFDSEEAAYQRRGTFMRWVLQDNKSSLEKGEVHQLLPSTASSYINEFDSSLLPLVTDVRARANLYDEMKTVSLIPITIADLRFLMVNNLPTKFRIVPRPFWEDGIQKIRMVKFIME